MLRFSPSPSGDMDIENLRVAILNYLVAQQKNDQFLIRIADINNKHNIEGKDTEIMMLLEKFALKHDSVFHQSEHLNLHQTLALRLLKDNKAFICKCNAQNNQFPEHYSGSCETLTQEDYSLLKKSGEKFVIRVKKPSNDIIINDMLQGQLRVKAKEIDSFIILKEDGSASHNFAAASDDIMSNINFIISTQQNLLNTAKELHIKQLMDYAHTTSHAHLPQLLIEHENSSIKWLLQKGFIPDAILNYLLLLGYTKAPQEIFTLPEAINWFDLENISLSISDFKLEQLRFINREHLKMMDDKELSKLFGFADADIGKLAKVYLDKECTTTNELEIKINPIFKAKNFTGIWGEEMKIISDLIAQAPAFETLSELTLYITNNSKLNDKNLLEPLRYLLTGTGNGPELSEIYPFIKSYILEVAS
ncbi:MAG: Glutamyl-tRNA(Gln) synthetase (EC [uncultured Sulfurovum sp.]|uniref:Glutamyl-tRNA(Gln) synthetase (EC) n=1 Tax=uncultured Sulfurovum sp. TaxID=269237 RepID=A0A6S6U828_9BACT|nr:MAG: Glutamyl-tRNA(Gln) synthetase (EC [uncultured Sulfurovum sp.]